MDNIHTFEVNDFALTVKNLYYDSMWTSDVQYKFVSIGGVTNDPFFGKTQAGLYVQFLPPSEGFTFPTGVIIDSALVSLPFNNFTYADTVASSTLSLKAYQITDPFVLGDGSRKYYAFNKLPYITTAIGSKTFTVKSLRDTTVVFQKDTVGGLLRMRLSNALCEQFRSMPPSMMATNAAFLDFFRGIYLGPDSTVQQNTLASFALSGGSTNTTYAGAQMEFFYHTATNDTLKRAIFPYNSLLCSFFNGIYRNYNGAPVQGYLANQQTLRDSIVLQGYPGFRTEVTVPIDPATIPPSIINKAALTVTLLKVGDDNRFSAPPQLIIRTVKDDGTEAVIDDLLNGDDSTANSSGPAFVGGTALSTLIGGSQYIRYIFNIPRTVQKAISAGKTQLRLRMLIPTAYQGSYRLVADGPGSANNDTKLRFNVIYTKLN